MHFTAPEARNTVSCFQQKDFYTVLGVDDKLSDRVERDFYGPVDNYVGKLLSEVESILEDGRAPTFNGEVKVSLDHLIVALFKRTRDAIQSINEDAVGREVVAARSQVGAASEPHGDDNGDEDQDTYASRKLGRHVRVLAQMREVPEVLEALENYDVHFVQATPRSAFLLGSRVIYRTANGTDSKLGSHDVELWMPISPRWCLVRAHRSLGLPVLVEWQQAWVRDLNEYIAGQSLAVASHSELLISSLVGRRPKQT